jgi:site-specific DNA-cytosine methylase
MRGPAFANVAGQGDSNWDIANAELSSRNFEVQGVFLDSLLYALPQSRKRFYVIGLRLDGRGKTGLWDCVLPVLIAVLWATLCFHA